MEVFIDDDERYPWFSLAECGYGKPVDVPPETVERWRTIESQWERMQEEMADAIGYYD